MKNPILKFYKKMLKIKVFIYKNCLSSLKPEGKYILQQPCIFKGEGKVIFGENAQIGYGDGPFLYSGYSQITSSQSDSVIKIDNSTVINNNAIIYAETTIEIGKNCMFGINFTCIDTDSHSIDPNKRCDYDAVQRAPIKIGDNVFIGNNVTILKGVTLGNNCTIGANSLVTKSFPDNSIIAGNPAKLIKVLEYNNGGI